MKKKYIYFSLILILLAILSSCPSNNVGAKSYIKSFVLEKAKNSFLTEDINAIVDDKANVVFVPILGQSLENKKNIVPTIVCDEDATIGGIVDGKIDLSVEPASVIVYSSSGVPNVYMLKAIKDHIVYADDALKISELYCGSAYTLSNANEQYIELQNLSDSEIDLGAYKLVSHVWENGIRKADKDMSTILSGTIPAKSFKVIFSERSTYSYGETGQSDKILNNCIRLSGQSSFELVQIKTNKTVDVVGPSDGFGDGRNYSLSKLLLRKNTKKPSTIWNEYDWLLYASTQSAIDKANAGIGTNSVPVNSTKITYFGFDEGNYSYFHEIDNDNKKIKIFMDNFDTFSNKILSPTIGIEGKTLKYNNEEFNSGKTKIDFSSDSIEIEVVASNDTTQKYKIDISDAGSNEVTYTTTNYDFDGGIKAVLDEIGSADGVSFSNREISGILTAKEVYGHADGQHSFFIQDKDAGIYVFTNIALPKYYKVGQKISITVTEGKSYYGMPEITAYSSVKLEDSSKKPIYYETGNYNKAEALGKVFMYEGSVTSNPDNYLVGKFGDNLSFHVHSNLEDSMKTGTNGNFYGPVTLSYDVYRMEISESTQIVE